MNCCTKSFNVEEKAFEIFREFNFLGSLINVKDNAEAARNRMKLEEKDRRLRREAELQMKNHENETPQKDQTASIIRKFSPLLEICPTDLREISAYFQRIEGIFENHKNC
ncbi:hypothetical protein HELRODRAFT_165042 [Helobdella robusta]|uniref:Uncharacterized protein n=1 Tax=Helobdella robusta TaxID=6412 RepID=T1EW66_HELRO|nr:hypothetical protein HELRODRAFT_165042 [Helobdella robusta]ESN92906.1 hypothetical protein HELRODRAFT_165042 [Helobdella robusta]